MSIDVQTEKQVIHKLLLQVSVGKTHNRMVSPPEEGVLKEAQEKESNIIISNYLLQ